MYLEPTPKRLPSIENLTPHDGITNTDHQRANDKVIATLTGMFPGPHSVTMARTPSVQMLL